MESVKTSEHSFGHRDRSVHDQLREKSSVYLPWRISPTARPHRDYSSPTKSRNTIACDQFYQAFTCVSTDSCMGLHSPWDEPLKVLAITQNYGYTKVTTCGVSMSEVAMRAPGSSFVPNLGGPPFLLPLSIPLKRGLTAGHTCSNKESKWDRITGTWVGRNSM